MAHALKNAGFKVIYTGLRKSVDKILDIAEAHDVDAIGLSILSGTHLIIAENLKQAMEKRNLHFKWVVGGNIPQRDVDALMRFGPDRVFPTGTQIQDVIIYFDSIKKK